MDRDAPATKDREQSPSVRVQIPQIQSRFTKNHQKKWSVANSIALAHRARVPADLTRSLLVAAAEQTQLANGGPFSQNQNAIASIVAPDSAFFVMPFHDRIWTSG